MTDPLELVRQRLGQSVRSLVAGDRVESTQPLHNPDPGYFGPGSAVWKVHADAAMLVGGVRALLLQTLHPLAMAAVAEHSSYEQDPLGRLHRTAQFVGVTTFGPTEVADQSIAQVRAIHDRVQGTAPDGRPYSAMILASSSGSTSPRWTVFFGHSNATVAASSRLARPTPMWPRWAPSA